MLATTNIIYVLIQLFNNFISTNIALKYELFKNTQLNSSEYEHRQRSLISKYLLLTTHNVHTIVLQAKDEKRTL